MRLLSFLSSIRLTLALLSLSMILVFFGTLDQVDWGIHEVQERYFQSWIALWRYPHYLPYGITLRKIPLIIPGGYTLGLLLLLNLICAHIKHFKWGLPRLGINILHLGLILLIISGFSTSLFQEESQMWLTLNKDKNYSENFLQNELAITKLGEDSTDIVTVIPFKNLTGSRDLNLDHIGISIETLEKCENATIGTLKSENQDNKDLLPKATQGVGKRMNLVIQEKPKTYKEDEINTATALIKLKNHEGDIGSWIVSNVLDERFPPQQFKNNGNAHTLALRFKRTYFPFSLQLVHFKKEFYPGTETPKSFESRVQITENGSRRLFTISMNQPLRYKGYTFYQASYSNDDEQSMLQVVKNPGWPLPYLSVGMVTLGLIGHFCIRISKMSTKGKR